MKLLRFRSKKAVSIILVALMIATSMPTDVYANATDVNNYDEPGNEDPDEPGNEDPDEPGNEDPHVHEYSQPVFNWSEDHSSCTVVFNCVDNDDEQELEASVTQETIDAKCNEEGTVTYTARVEFEDIEYVDAVNVTLEALEHEYESKVEAPACTKDGYTRHTCSRCGDFYDDEIVDALDHDYDIQEIAATCLDRGCTLHICSRCGNIYQDEETPALGHNYVSTVIDPTCSDRGYTLNYCLRCKQTVKDGEKEALGHDLSEEIVEQKASPMVQGTIKYKCVRCDESRTENILSPAQVVLSKLSYDFDGSEKKPAVKVYDTDGKIIEDSNYTVEYTNNIQIGTAKAEVFFGGAMYDGVLSETFEIKDKNILSGKCGNNATWTLDLSTGKMTITGTGDMEDYKYSTRTPWVKYRDNIKTVNIDKGITRIGTNTFYNCTQLTEVTGCAGVLSIGINTFRNCKKLTKVAGCTKLTLAEQYAFCGDPVFSTIGSVSGTLNLPMCEKIGGYTFYECKGIVKLVTSDKMTYIGTRAFSNCTAMTDVKIGSKCTIIGSYSFCGNLGLTSVTGCAGLTGIGAFAFYQNEKLATIEGCAKVTNIGDSAFRNCKRLVKVGATAGQFTFASVQKVGEYAFSGCIRAKCINLGSNLSSIGKLAFQNCIAVNGLYLRSTKLTYVGEKAFFCMKYTAIIYVPSSKMSEYRNGVLKNKGQGSEVKIRGL